MSNSASESPPEISYHRTNSLAFAKTDCHTCSALNRWCDRQRPQCGTCVKHRRKCGGFVLDLTWKDQGLGEVGASPSPSVTDCGNAPERQFKFKQGRPRKKRKTRVCNGGETTAPGSVPGSVRARRVPRSGSLKTRPSRRISLTPETAVEEQVVPQPVAETSLDDTWIEREENSYPSNPRLCVFKTVSQSLSCSTH